jgi:hypothetical protein
MVKLEQARTGSCFHNSAMEIQVQFKDAVRVGVTSPRKLD